MDIDVKKVAELARIKINKQESERFGKELSSVLDYIDKLNKVNTSSVEPLHQITGLVNSSRDDVSRKSFKMDEKLNEKLIGQAPHKKDRFVKVKSVLRKS